MHRFIKYLFLLSLSFSVLSAKEPDIKLGMWTLSMSVEIPGVSFKIPPTMHSACLKKKDINPDNYKNMKNCKLLEHKITNTSVEGKMECQAGSAKSLYKAQMNYTPTTATGTMSVISGDVEIQSKLSAIRTGECK